MIKKIFFLFSAVIYSQNIDVNNNFTYEISRYLILNGDLETDLSLNIRPVKFDDFSEIFKNSYKLISSSKNNKFQLKNLGIDYFIEYNSHHPYNRNNGTMIPNRGYQHIFSPGIFLKLGPLSIKLKPEQHYSQNKPFDGFWEGHYDYIWMQRYKLWNKIDMPERFGFNNHNKTTFGQSNFMINLKKISIGLSKENLWWGPSIRNSIMMSNHAEGFYHITFNTNKPINTSLGNFEWQLITGKLENSGFNPPNINREYAGRKLFIPKINQNGKRDDWRYLQGLIISYTPKWINGLSVGFIKWTQMYYAQVEGKYWWMEGKPSYFPIFNNLFRKNDKYENYEAQTNQAAGIFLKWLWLDSKSEIYFEFHHNDAKQNFRDLLLDSDHSRALTIGLQKIFKINNQNILFNWEWTQMEQSASNLIRNAGSWYEHGGTYDGYTNKGEVLGSSIGPGSNSHYLSLNKVLKDEKIGIGVEIIEHDNDFYHLAFASASDFRRYWKDFNFHLNYYKSFKNFNLSSNLVYVRSLNYQWELKDNVEPYYRPGRDVNNFHLSLKFSYFIY